MPRIVADEIAPPGSGKKSKAAATGARSRAARFFLGRLYFWARHAPWMLKLVKPLVVWVTVRCSGAIRNGTRANARRILGPGVTREQCAEFTAKVTANFYDFVVEVGHCGAMTAQQLARQVESVHGHEEYLAARRAGGGAIMLTAHMGSFEVGIAALRAYEQNIHVVFKRDEMDRFETIRRTLRDTLGVHEAPVDAGWDTWVGLRDALESNHVVVMQGDRAMPGQKAQSVPILGGHLALPLGPIVLAQISGSPIVPVFVVRTASGGSLLFVESAIRVDPDARLIDGVHPQLLAWGKVLEKFIAKYPEQWLFLDPAFVEDNSPT
ncbi:MAG: lysophospholipid acyltransferase family protein [Tepidisphaeraceae bacterium]